MAESTGNNEQALQQAMRQCERDAVDPQIIGPKPSPAADETPLVPGSPGRQP
jgi:hypothetical protein